MNKIEFLEHIRNDWYDPNIVKINKNIEVSIDKSIIINNEICENEYLKKTTDIIHYYAILNSINHQFWSHNENGDFVRYSNNNKVGAMALSSGMDQMLTHYKGLENIPELTVPIFKQFFGDMPNIEQRIKILNQAIGPAGKECALQLTSKIKEGWTILEAVDIANTLPLGYKDEALKKAQLLLHMASSALKSKNVNVDIDVTCFADYQVPRVLRHLGILEYSNELASTVDNNIVIPVNSKEEKAIRAATILACEEISDTLKIHPATLDFWLWSQRNSATKPFHLTYTTAY